MKTKEIVYDRYPHEQIKLSDGEVVTLGELEQRCRLGMSFSAYAPWSKNPKPRKSRIWAHMSADGVLALFDHKTGISHRMASAKPPDVDLQKLAAGLREFIVMGGRRR